MRVTRLVPAQLPLLRGGGGAAGPGPDRGHGAATGPARRTCSRRSTSPAPGRSCRTANEREVVRFGAGVARLELDAERDGDGHRITVGFEPGEAKRLAVDGAPVDRLTDSAARPLVSVFLPDRLDLVLGAPALRRAHLDQVIAALWPAASGRAAPTPPRWPSATRCWARSAPAARAAARCRRGTRSWPATASRWPRTAPPRSRELAEPFAAHAEALGLEGGAELAYRPRSKAERRGGAGRRARRARGLRPRARLHRPRAAPRRARAARAPAASCAPTGRAASSGWGCWRCCWPSAACWPPSAGPRR